MNQESKLIEKNISHVITIDNQKKMMLTAIVEVVSATDKAVITKTNNKTINIIGRELRVAKLNLEEGLLIIEGIIESFKYIEKNTSKGFLKKVFK